ncbi:MAG: hypothetical protein HQ465_05490 [Rhodospirillales bacterium]|nr:hypothetical protein [Rhodospirillales bacterium]
MLLRLAIAFVASWAIYFSQISTLDNVPPDYIDKGIHCLHAMGHTLTMDKLRSLFSWLVAAQIAGVVLIALRIVPLVCIPLVVFPLFWGRLVGVCPW